MFPNIECNAPASTMGTTIPSIPPSGETKTILISVMTSLLCFHSSLSFDGQISLLPMLHSPAKMLGPETQARSLFILPLPLCCCVRGLIFLHTVYTYNPLSLSISIPPLRSSPNLFFCPETLSKVRSATRFPLLFCIFFPRLAPCLTYPQPPFLLPVTFLVHSSMRKKKYFGPFCSGHVDFLHWLG